MRTLILFLAVASVHAGCAEDSDPLAWGSPKGQLTVTDAAGAIVGQQSNAVAHRHVVEPAAGESCTASYVLLLDGDTYIFSADPLVAGSTHDAYCPLAILPADPLIGFEHSACQVEVLSVAADGTGISVALTGPFCADVWDPQSGWQPHDGCAEQRLTVDLVTVEGNAVVFTESIFGDVGGVASPDTDLCLPTLDW
jgi:hypothetical protein